MACLATMASLLTLVTGTESLLGDRAVARVVREVKSGDPETEVHVFEPGGFEPGQISAVASPSLFGGPRVLVVRRAHEMPADAVAELVATVEAGEVDVYLVATHSGAANRARPVLDCFRKSGAEEVSAAPLKKFNDRLAFVQHEFRSHRRRIVDEAARALLEAVGDDLRELASACSQLMSDTPGDVDLSAVRRYYEGRADMTSFVVADRAVEGRTAEAIEAFRYALAAGVAPVLVTSALAAQLRAMVRVAAAPRGLSPGDVARQAGVPPWKVDRLRQQLRGWDGDGVSVAIRAVADADAHVKGAGGDVAYAVERAIVTVANART